MLEIKNLFKSKVPSENIEKSESDQSEETTITDVDEEFEKERLNKMLEYARAKADELDEKIQQQEKETRARMLKRKPYTNEWEREILGYKEIEDKERELEIEYPILIKFTYSDPVRFKNKEEAIAALQEKYRIPRIYDIYVPIADELERPLFSFERREAYTFIKKLQLNKNYRQYRLTEESREMFRQDILKYNANHGIGVDVQWKKYESLLREDR